MKCPHCSNSEGERTSVEYCPYTRQPPPPDLRPERHSGGEEACFQLVKDFRDKHRIVNEYPYKATSHTSGAKTRKAHQSRILPHSRQSAYRRCRTVWRVVQRTHAAVERSRGPELTTIPDSVGDPNKELSECMSSQLPYIKKIKPELMTRLLMPSSSLWLLAVLVCRMPLRIRSHQVHQGPM